MLVATLISGNQLAIELVGSCSTSEGGQLAGIGSRLRRPSYIRPLDLQHIED